MPTLDFSIEYLQNKTVLGVEIKGDESRTTREPISLQTGEKTQSFVRTPHGTVRRARCGKYVCQTYGCFSVQTCLIRTLLDHIFYMCTAHRTTP